MKLPILKIDIGSDWLFIAILILFIISILILFSWVIKLRKKIKERRDKVDYFPEIQRDYLEGPFVKRNVQIDYFQKDKGETEADYLENLINTYKAEVNEYKREIINHKNILDHYKNEIEELIFKLDSLETEFYRNRGIIERSVSQSAPQYLPVPKNIILSEEAVQAKGQQQKKTSSQIQEEQPTDEPSHKSEPPLGEPEGKEYYEGGYDLTQRKHEPEQKNQGEQPPLVATPEQQLGQSEEDVNISLSYPPVVKPKQSFTIRVSAYLTENRTQVQNFLSAVAPADQHLMEADNCRWKRGTKVNVRVYSPLLEVNPEIQEFKWTGKHKVLSFDATVDSNVILGSYLLLKVDILIAGIVIARLRGDLKVGIASGEGISNFVTNPIKTAFASYASADIDLVLGRLSEIERNGVKIFWDRISLQTGKDWQQQLCDAIKENEAFLLFWSSNARASEYVNWEWKTALECKGLDGIDPHPLESPSVAPPPEELSSLHFDDKYLYFQKR